MSATDRLPAIEGVLDLTQMRKIYQGAPVQRAMLLNLMRLACERIPDDLAAARAAWEGGDAAAAAALVHGLRGGVGWMRAHHFDGAALALERALAENAGRGARDDFAACDSALAVTVAAARAWLAQQKG
jgi:two-component system sensor histidine kinase/response regulator